MHSAPIVRSTLLVAGSLIAYNGLVGGSPGLGSMLVGSSFAEPARGTSAASATSSNAEEAASACPCADERDWVDAERGTPSVLLTMAQEALLKCEGTVATRQ